MERLLEEIKKIQNEVNPILDKKCIGLYNTTVVFLENGNQMNLTDDYFKNIKSSFDPYFAGCYITPGKVTTIREIHINALKSEVRNQLIKEYYEDKNNFIKKKEIFFEYLPELIKEM